MIPIPRDVAARDIEQWCSNGYVWAPYSAPDSETKQLVLCLYMGSADSRGRRIVRLSVVRPVELRGFSFDVASKDVYVDWPLCGSVNIPGGQYAVHAARLTQRQYRRTFHRQGLHVTVPRIWDVARKLNAYPEQQYLVADEQLAVACFFPEYPTMDAAFKMLDSGERVTVAINPRVIVAGDSTGKRMFYYNGVLAATAHGDSLFPCGDESLVKRIIKLTDGRYNATSYR